MSAALIARLENWARHFRDRPSQGKAGSAEGNYRIPQPDYSAIIELFPELKDALEAPRACGGAPDMRDAQIIQDAVKRLPERYRLLLAMWHIRMLPEARIERVLKFARGRFQIEYWNALRELSHILDKNNAVQVFTTVRMYAYTPA